MVLSRTLPSVVIDENLEDLVRVDLTHGSIPELTEEGNGKKELEQFVFLKSNIAVFYNTCVSDSYDVGAGSSKSENGSDSDQENIEELSLQLQCNCQITIIKPGFNRQKSGLNHPCFDQNE